MSGGIVQYNAQQKAVQRVYAEIERKADTTRKVINALADLTDGAALRVALVRLNQTALEMIAPEASDLLNLIVTTGAMNIARQVNDFGSRF